MELSLLWVGLDGGEVLRLVLALGCLSDGNILDFLIFTLIWS